VQQARFPNGDRRVIVIAEVTGTESGRIQMQDLFRYDRAAAEGAAGPAGRFRACGNEPVFFERFAPDARPAPLGAVTPC
jgi:pilus assembly protein CpaF